MKKKCLHKEHFEQAKKMFSERCCFYSGELQEVRQILRKKCVPVDRFIPYSDLYREDVPDGLPAWKVCNLSKDYGWAELLGYTASNFSNIRTGKRFISIDSLRLISNLTGLTEKYLCGETDEATEKQGEGIAFEPWYAGDEILIQALYVLINGDTACDRDLMVGVKALNDQAINALLNVTVQAIRNAAQTFLAGVTQAQKEASDKPEDKS